jgi:hypothetical protein
VKFRPGGFAVDKVFRKILPRGLFGRSLLIVVIPMILLQAVALDIFYGSHLHELSRRLAEAVAGDVAFEVDAIDREPDTRFLVFLEADKHFDFKSQFWRNQILQPKAWAAICTGPSTSPGTRRLLIFASMCRWWTACSASRCRANIFTSARSTFFWSG